MANGYIGQVHIDSTNYKIGSTLFAVLDTANSQGTITTSNETTTFTVPLDGFVSTEGVTVHIKFVQANSEPSNLALKVGGDSAHSITNPNGALTWQANSVISFTYDGANWVMNSSAIDGSSIQNLSLGNITNEGKLGTASMAVITDANKLITTENLSVSDPSSGGNSTAFTFIDTISQNSKGKITPTKKAIPTVSSSTAGLAPKGATVSSQDQNTKFLREDGSWAVPSYTQDTNTRRSIKINGTEILTSSSTTALDLTEGSNISITNSSGVVTIANTYSYTLPLADSSGTRGGIQIGYSESNSGSNTSRNYAVKLSSEKAYVNVPWTDTKVKQTAKTDSVAYKLLFSAAGASPTSGTAYEAVYYTGLTFNPSSKTLSIVDGSTTGTLTATNYSGKAATAGTADSANAVPWSGITSTPTTLSGYGITDALSNNTTITIAGNSVSLNGGSLTADTLRTSLGLSKALRFVGITTSNISDGWTGVPAGITSYTTPVVGDVVIKGDYEYVCVSVSGTTYTWELLGGDSSFALDDAVIHNSLLTTTGDIIYRSSSAPARLGIGTAGQVLTVSGGVPVWADNAATDKKVEQKKYTSSTNSEFRLLFKKSANNTDETDLVYYSDIANKNITYNPSTGALSAAKFIGDGSSLTNVTASSVALDDVTNADDLKAIEALGGTSGFLKKTAANSWTLDTSVYLTSQDTTHLYVNKTASPGTSPSNAAVTASDTLYLHLYDSTTKRDSIQIKGSGGTSITATNGQVITITSKTYSATTTTVLNSLTLKYTDSLGDDHTETPSTDTFVAAVDRGTLFIKSIVYGTDSTVNTGFTPNN